MSVTIYNPKSQYGCRYSYDKLDNVVYLVSEDHLKEVYVDNGEAYIDDLTEEPLRLDCFNIQFSEESSLDERYKFTKQLTFSINGYVPLSTLNKKFYAIIKSKDGTKWMINVDFPSKVTYTFNLDSARYQTDFTFSSVSNFPTLRLATAIDEGVSPCKQMRTFGIDYLKLLETDYCSIDTDDCTVHTFGKDFVDVVFLGDSCSLQEIFDGEKAETTINFNIAFDAYKSSWHYNLLEFLQNHYSSIIKVKGADDYFFSGFNFGLEPSFTVSTTSDNGMSDIITVTLRETSSYGLEMASIWTEEEDTDTHWAYVGDVDGIQGWECVGLGTARYLLMQELNQIGTPTGRYKALEGYSSHFPTLNIVGEFTDEYLFYNPSCNGYGCKVITDLPNTITYTSATCNTYSYSASCDWEVSGLASYMTVTPSSGFGGIDYTLTVCNTKTPDTNESSTFSIISGDNVKIVNVNLVTKPSFINPTSTTITCLAQNVPFNFDPTCLIRVTSIDSRLSYTITNTQLIVQVPRNYSVESGITWTIGVMDCHNNTTNVTIIQDRTYERWVNTANYMCESGNSYVIQMNYTGTTSTNINTVGGQFRKGDLIQTQDPRCVSYETKWEESSDYVCIDGDKWSFEEEYIKYEGGTWQKTGNTRLKTLVEADSEDCQETVEYKWVLTEQWQCYGGEVPIQVKFRAEYSDSTTYSAACDSSTELSSATTRAHSTSYTAMTDAEIGNCITSIGRYAFYDCSSLSSIDIPNSVTSIGDYAFRDCSSLTSIDIPSGVTSIASYVFRGCSSLTSIDIPSGVTSIGGSAFSGCTSLTSIDIPSGVATIGSSAFAYCSGLTSIDIPNSATSIGSSAFYYCTSLTSITIGSGVTYIGGSAFYGCSSLSSIDIPSGVTTIGNSTFRNCRSLTSCTIGSGVTSIGTQAFQNCNSLTSIDIPNGVTRIGANTFYNCSGLTSIDIPSGVISIGTYAFYNCSNLSSITINATTPPTLDSEAFYNTNCYIYVPAASVSAYQSASGWSDYASRIQAIP